MMNGGTNSKYIPMDLLPEILSRLPAKSVGRFRCVSKLWNSIICRQDFIELFRTMSSYNPRLLIGVKHFKNVGWKTPTMRTNFRLYSSPQPQNHYGKLSPVVATADLHTKFSEDQCYYNYASGLLFFTKIVCEDEDDDDNAVRVICNPSTGQYMILPPDDLITTFRTGGGLLGFDPIGKQFKVLVFNCRYSDEMVYHILTLGTEKMRWREIICPSVDGPQQYNIGICVNGVLYYDIAYGKIGYFDVRSEKFKSLDVDPYVLGCFQSWINCKGKLCGIHLEYSDNGGFPIKLSMWVLEDVEKGEWSSYAYTLNADYKVVKVNSTDNSLSVVGVTALGEIVLVKQKVDKPFYVFYFNPETNTLVSVEIQGVVKDGEEYRHHEVHCFVDHVEDLSFDVMNTTYAATSNIRPPEHSTSTLSKEDLQVRTVAHVEQARPTFERQI